MCPFCKIFCTKNDAAQTTVTSKSWAMENFFVFSIFFMIFPKHIFLCSHFVCKNPKTIHHPKALSKNFDGIQFEFANVVFKLKSL